MSWQATRIIANGNDRSAIRRSSVSFLKVSHLGCWFVAGQNVMDTLFKAVQSELDFGFIKPLPRGSFCFTMTPSMATGRKAGSKSGKGTMKPSQPWSSGLFQTVFIQAGTDP